MFSTVDLLIEVACIVTKEKNQYKSELIKSVQGGQRTEPSASIFGFPASVVKLLVHYLIP